MNTTSWPRETSSCAMPTAGETLPPPSHVAKAKRVISRRLEDLADQVPNTGFGFLPASRGVAPEKLPCVDVAGNNQAVEHELLVLASRQLGCKLALDGPSMGFAAPFERLSE